jgi:hypothetical protein
MHSLRQEEAAIHQEQTILWYWRATTVLQNQHAEEWSAALSTVGALEVIVALGRNPIFIPTCLWLAKFLQTFLHNQHIFFHHIVTALNKLSHPADGGSMILHNIGTNVADCMV